MTTSPCSTPHGVDPTATAVLERTLAQSRAILGTAKHASRPRAGRKPGYAAPPSRSAECRIEPCVAPGCCR